MQNFVTFQVRWTHNDPLYRVLRLRYDGIGNDETADSSDFFTNLPGLALLLLTFKLKDAGEQNVVLLADMLMGILLDT